MTVIIGVIIGFGNAATRGGALRRTHHRSVGLYMQLLGVLLGVASATAAGPSSLHGVHMVAKSHPFAFGVSLTCFKTACADVFTQRAVLERRWSEIDLRRVSIFAAYGLLHLGCVQHFLFTVSACA